MGGHGPEADFWPVENFTPRLKTFSKRITSLQPVVRDELTVSQERIQLREFRKASDQNQPLGLSKTLSSDTCCHSG
jgi:hypothetical protein